MTSIKEQKEKFLESAKNLQSAGLYIEDYALNNDKDNSLVFAGQEIHQAGLDLEEAVDGLYEE